MKSNHPALAKRARIVAAIERHLTAYLELDRQCSDLTDAGTPKAQAELDRLHNAVDAAEDELAKIMTERVFLGWLEDLGGLPAARRQRKA